MEIILLIAFGALIGWIASIVMKVMKVDPPQGVILNIIVGIIGAVIGGLLTSSFGENGVSSFNLYSFMVAPFGAILLITIVKTMGYDKNNYDFP